MSNYTEMRANWYEPAPKKGKYRNLTTLAWDIGRKDSGLTYIVPIGTTFDVSVPWIFSWIFAPDDSRFMKAACIHDQMIKENWDRTTAGGVFNDALRADGVSKLKRWAMFTAVTWFKWS